MIPVLIVSMLGIEPAAFYTPLRAAGTAAPSRQSGEDEAKAIRAELAAMRTEMNDAFGLLRQQIAEQRMEVIPRTPTASTLPPPAATTVPPPPPAAKPMQQGLYASSAAGHWSWPGDLRQHLRDTHRIDASRMTDQACIQYHDSLHTGTRVRSFSGRCRWDSKRQAWVCR